MRSIRTSLVVGTVVATVAVIAVAGVVLHRSVHATLIGQLDVALEGKAGLLASTVEVEPDSVELGFKDLDMSEFEPGDEEGYLQVWLEDESVLYRSPSLKGADIERLIDEEEAEFYTTLAPSERRVRAVGITFSPKVDVDDEEEGEDDESGGSSPVAEPPEEEEQENLPVVSLVLARGTESIDDFLAGLRNLLVAIGVVMALVAGGVLTVVVRKNLEPLDHLAGKIAGLDDSRLSSRIDLARTPRELSPVVDRLNELLRRLELAFQRERTFSADVAHELRTPLAGLRSAMEVAMSRSREADDYRQTLVESLEIVRRIQNMVQTMLYLCRLDAGQVETEERRVQVDELLQASWKPVEDVAVGRGINVEWKLSPTAAVVTDPILLEVALRNILENAVVHADEGGYVRVEVNGGNKPTDIRVVNSGSKVGQDEVPQLLERFARANGARDSASPRAGLGLAIVSKIAEILRASLDIRAMAGGEFDVTMSLNDVDMR